MGRVDVHRCDGPSDFETRSSPVVSRLSTNAAMSTAAGESEFRRPEWSEDATRRFWDYWSRRPDAEGWYFSRRYGRAIVNLAKWSGVLHGDVLDYGFARGCLIDELLPEDVTVRGLEFSPASVDRANARFGGAAHWAGATTVSSLPSPLADRSQDVVFCIELVEHLLDDWLDSTFREISRLTRPGGYVIVTTPNAECLDNSYVYCPFCESEFHSVQHVQSWSEESLRELLDQHGFEVPFCRGVDLERFRNHRLLPPARQWSFDVLKRYLGYSVLSALDALNPRPALEARRFRRSALRAGPHLCAIARRR